LSREIFDALAPVPGLQLERVATWLILPTAFVNDARRPMLFANRRQETETAVEHVRALLRGAAHALEY
jgi:hypothetical protein